MLTATVCLGMLFDMPKWFPQERKDEIITRYRNGQPASEIALAMNIHRTAIYSVLRRSGVETRRTLVVLNDAQRRQVADRYKAGNDARNIAKDFGCDYATVYNIIRKLGVETRFNVTTRPKKKPGKKFFYDVDATAFDTLTPECLYWLGFIFADGYIEESERNFDYNGQRKLKVALGMLDAAHLEKLRRFCRSEHPLCYVTNGKSRQAVWQVRSDHIVEKLKSYGMRIGRTLAPIPDLTESRDFWRGFVDGDGAVGTTVRGSHIIADTQLTDQLPTLTAYADFLRTTVSIELKPYKLTDVNAWRVDASGKKAEVIIRELYRDNTLSLDRKNERAQAIIRGDLRRFPPYGEE